MNAKVPIVEVGVAN